MTVKMKIVEISCPSCGGKLKMEDSRSGLVRCEYCGNQFLLDDEKVQNVTNYHIYQDQPLQPIRVRKESEAGSSVARVLAIAMGGTAAFFILIAVLIGIAGRNSSRSAPPYDVAGPMQNGVIQEEDTLAEEAERSGLFEAMTEEMFGRGDASPSELARVKYLKVVSSSELAQVWYSFDDPYGEEPVIRKAVFAPTDWDERDIRYFSGLIRLETERSLPSGMDLRNLTDLRGLSVPGMEFSRLADLVADPEQITDLEVRHIDSMEGILSFPNLERLSVEDMPDENLKQLVALKRLKHLVLNDTEDSDSLIHDGDEIRVTDYSAISAMKGLETLSIRSDLIKDLGFLAGLPALTSLELNDTSVISLEPLGQIPELRRLYLIDNNKAADYEVVAGLTGLTELLIDKSTSQPDPDLSALKDLEKLEISGFMSVSGLKGLTGIRDLSIHSCNVDGASALSTLTGVERLTFYSVWNSYGKLTDMDFLDGMSSLTYADFYGNLDGSGWSGYRYLLEVYGDVSSIFNHEGLEELYLHNGMFEIRFDRIRENPTLRVLGLNNMDLHANFYVESYGGILNAWYDDVAFHEHLDFLEKFPALEELYLEGNEITDLDFTLTLENLSRLDVRDNYITDLSPLIRAEHLTYLDIRDNPAGETDWADEDVEIIR